MNFQQILIIENLASVFVLLLTALIFWSMRDDAAKKINREATEHIYREWWGDELRELRRFFYHEFVPKYRPKLLGKCIKEIEATVPADDRLKVRKLLYFFERVGWLGAAGLIEVDYVLGPMQHCLRFVWLAMEPFIREERHPQHLEHADSSHHSVYMSGFEWLYKRSCQIHQADLIHGKFRKPRLRSSEEIKALREWIDNDEARFRETL
jgi:hypothetical protein